MKFSKQFERLENFIKQGEWVKADLELDLLQPQYLTCSQLSEIDKIYSGYSHGSFGYRMQRYLWGASHFCRYTISVMKRVDFLSLKSNIFFPFMAIMELSIFPLNQPINYDFYY